MNEPNRRLPGPHDNLFIYTDNIYGSRQKFDLEHVGFGKIHLCLVCHSLNSKEWLLMQSNMSYILRKAASLV